MTFNLRDEVHLLQVQKLEEGACLNPQYTQGPLRCSACRGAYKYDFLIHMKTWDCRGGIFSYKTHSGGSCGLACPASFSSLWVTALCSSLRGTTLSPVHGQSSGPSLTWQRWGTEYKLSQSESLPWAISFPWLLLEESIHDSCHLYPLAAQVSALPFQLCSVSQSQFLWLMAQ